MRMRKIIVSEFVSLDGVCEAPERWSLDYWNDEIAAFKQEELFSVGALMLGRVLITPLRRRGQTIPAIPTAIA